MNRVPIGDYIAEGRYDDMAFAMSKPYKAWGGCGECDHVGDMWFEERVPKHTDEMAPEIFVVGMCPLCSCDTPLDDMPEFPADV